MAREQFQRHAVDIGFSACFLCRLWPCFSMIFCSSFMSCWTSLPMMLRSRLRGVGQRGAC